MSTLNRVFLTSNLLLLALILGVQSTPPVNAAGSDEISACASKSSGALRISKKCTKSESIISWSKTGASGKDALVKTKQVKIRYVGDSDLRWPCGEGTPITIARSVFTFKEQSPYSFDVAQLTSQSGWSRNQICEVTLNVLE